MYEERYMFSCLKEHNISKAGHYIVDFVKSFDID